MHFLLDAREAWGEVQEGENLSPTESVLRGVCRKTPYAFRVLEKVEDLKGVFNDKSVEVKKEVENSCSAFRA